MDTSLDCTAWGDFLCLSQQVYALPCLSISFMWHSYKCHSTLRLYIKTRKGRAKMCVGYTSNILMLLCSLGFPLFLQYRLVVLTIIKTCQKETQGLHCWLYLDKYGHKVANSLLFLPDLILFPFWLQLKSFWLLRIKFN